MDKTNIIKWCVDICLGWIMLLVLITLTKLASDFLTTPNVFMTAKAEVISQKQTDDMCGAWWFNTNVAEAKKRICGK
jgi:hypothetical protein